METILTEKVVVGHTPQGGGAKVENCPTTVHIHVKTSEDIDSLSIVRMKAELGMKLIASTKVMNKDYSFSMCQDPSGGYIVFVYHKNKNNEWTVSIRFKVTDKNLAWEYYLEQLSFIFCEDKEYDGWGLHLNFTSV
jgi:hypothetical protein